MTSNGQYTRTHEFLLTKYQELPQSFEAINQNCACVRTSDVEGIAEDILRILNTIFLIPTERSFVVAWPQ